MRRHVGSALVDYVGAVVVVGALMATLVAVGAHEVSRRPPLRPAAALAKLVTAPVVRARPRARPVVPRPRRAPRPSRPRRGPVIVDAPTWLAR